MLWINMLYRLRFCVIWPHGSSGMVFSGSGAEFKPRRNYIDVEEVKQPCSTSWWEMCHLSGNGAILVRPDEHIAWITESNTIKDPVSELDRVFFTILGKRP
ncbi:hypothetical protein HPP92_001243 [Vanilla planifolia]|uniref:Uncharacterized protein n=1 Tax=Vanilla planifolia TaxID=51239 RepID=A0A835VF61_VANPL|nr:hypothetical protein HPP92_001243 [Vanilla planifolia]